ncbi:hypothetical protein OS175_10085 [Marinicella sp. S1101]|uniref:WD40/YVTN/BNR-like repeat-containing protein n=1 Tax=Marinicella marina TaxID=2996016 RepID=UPI002260CE74|nr:hypothetical protein [Marinicella marina]MCX7554228.1 hypothetical protein [Marinicella marina]MDJ1138779.1 hypothetical protein [Marinicella marina]
MNLIKTLGVGLLLGFGSHLMAEVPSSYKNQIKAWNQNQNMRAETPYKGITWRNVGPVVQGGRAVDVIRPTDQPHVIYVGYASGGVWKSTNNGLTFKPLTDQLPSQIVGSLVVDPNDSETLWLGTGENNSSRSSYGGMGVYKSTDGGESWQYKGLGDTDRIGRILVDPDDSNRIYVAALGKLYTQGGQRGLYRSDDGGETWETLIAGDGWTGFIDVAKAKNGVLYASAWERSRRAWNFVEGGKGSAIYRSTDDGDNWERLSAGLPQGKHTGRMGLTVSVSQPDTLYVSLDNQTPLPESEWDMGDSAVNVKRLKNMDKATFLSQDEKAVESFLRSNNFPPEMTAETVIEEIEKDELTPQALVEQLASGNDNLFNVDIKSLEIYRSDDGGDTFYRTHDKDIQGVVFSYGYYFGQVKVDPTDVDTVYATGVPFIKSTDGGKTWASAWDSSVHADIQAIWIDPNHSNHIMVGNDGGVDESFDGGQSWRKIDAQPVGQFYTIAVDMEEPYNIYGGLQDNGTLKGSSSNLWHNNQYRGNDWQRIFGGDGMHVNIDDEDKLTYVGFQFGNSFRLSSAAPKKITPPNYVGEESLRKNWNTPVMMSTHNKDILYYAGHKVYRSMNKGDDWTTISEDLTESERRGDVPFATITSLSESPLKFGLIWAGTDDGLVWVTADGGNNWKRVNQRLTKGKWVSRVIASPHQEERAWLAFNNYRNDDIKPYLYKTENLGKRWKNMAKGLPNETINVVKEDPKNEDIVYVGTDKGIYVSTNQGEDWHMLGQDLPTTPVHDLIVHPRENELILGTHGRSVFVADVNPLQSMTTEITDGALHVFAVDDFKERNNWDSKPFRWAYTDNMAAQLPVHIWSAQGGATQVSITGKDGAAYYSAEVTLDEGLNQWHWDYKIDINKAIEIETAALNADQEEDQESNSITNKADTPYAESKRLGHPDFIEPGDYKLVVKQGDDEHSVEFKVK